MNKLLLIFMSSLIISCAHYSPIYWEYGEWEQGDLSAAEADSIAILEWSRHPGVVTSIDGNSLGEGYKKAKLLPGIHVIEYQDRPAEFGHHPKGSIQLELKAGHLYELRIKYCFWCVPRMFAVWVDDKTSGELVWGTRPDWPSWYL